MKMEQTECSETSAYKIQTPGNYPEENIQHSHICLFPLSFLIFIHIHGDWGPYITKTFLVSLFYDSHSYINNTPMNEEFKLTL